MLAMDDSTGEEHCLKMTLEDFLRSREIPEDRIAYINNEKIDCSTLLNIPEEELKQIIPKYGDRVAILSFCKSTLNSNKHSLIQKLKMKIDEKQTKKRKNSPENKKKLTRIIEIGWLCMDYKSKQYRQVRAKCGGGTRRIPVQRTMRCSEILNIGQELFFPNGKSTRGDINLFEIELLDFKNHKFDLKMSVQDMYELSAMSTLRFYIATSYKEGIEIPKERDDDFIPATTVHDTPVQRYNTRSMHRNVGHSENFELSMTEPREREDSGGNIQLLMNESRTENSEGIANYLPTFLAGELDFNLSSPLPEISSDDITIGSVNSYLIGGNEESLTELENTELEILILHRGNIFQELLDAFRLNNFKNNISRRQFQIQIILPNGESEAAEDFGGVFRDVLSEFWSTFYEKCSVGTSMKVPYIRDDFKESHWRACAQIMVTGLTTQKYFPIKLAPTFVKKCFELEVTENELLDNFFSYISESERTILMQAIQDYTSVDKDDIIDFFSSYETTGIPSEKDIKERIVDLAHKELIQKTRFVSECFHNIFVENFILYDEIKDLFINITPTVKNCWSKIKTENEFLTAAQEKTLQFLKKYLREVDDKRRMSFCRFCTSSDLPTSNLTISFVETTGLARRPIAHTCSGLLQLPSTYENFVVFRGEWDSLLSSNVWIMDIV